MNYENKTGSMMVMLELQLIWFISYCVALLALGGAVGSSSALIRKLLSLAALLPTIVGVSVVLPDFSYVQAIALVLTSLLVVLAYRVFVARMHANQLKRTVTRDAIRLLVATELLLLVWLLIDGFSITRYSEEMAFAGVSVILSTYLLIITYIRMRSWRYREQNSERSPSLSVAIPARNEDHALTEHLDKLIASDYEKLEILVLDDCSQDETAEIVRSYAHDGVRFIQGSAPPEGWLGKNYAYQQLLDEASGEYILFAGVDIHFEPDTISRLVSYTAAKELDMVSVMPKRRHLDAASTIAQPLRYIRELLLGVRRNPPALSSCWIIRADTLRRLGGFGGIRNTVLPESYIARALGSDKYEFIVADKRLGITTRKRLSSQYETAIRTIYPSLRRSIGYVAINLVILLLGAILPFWLLLTSGSDVVRQLVLASLLMLAIQQSYMLFLINKSAWWLGIFQLPIAVTLEFALIIISMIRYEQADVEWKNRNICIPIYPSD